VLDRNIKITTPIIAALHTFLIVLLSFKFKFLE